MAAQVDTDALSSRVASSMPQLRGELAQLVAIPSVSASDYPEETRPALLEAHQARARPPSGGRRRELQLARARGHRSGASQVRSLRRTARRPSCSTATTTSCRPATRRCGPPRRSRRPSATGPSTAAGTADSKANILVHVGALRAWGGRPPVGVKLLIEGQEEVGSPLEDGYPAANPEAFRADAILVADGGSIRAGEPSLTVSLRGDARITAEARTLASNKHSGQYGGAAPDALVVLVRALASLWDANGDVAVEGLRREEWTGESYTEDEFRQLAEVEDGMPIVGTGGIGSKIWSGPAVTVLGIDCPPVEAAPASVQSYARAVLNVRVHPEQPAAEAQAAVMRHLEAQRPFGVPLEVTAGAIGDGFRASSSGPAWDAMVAAMSGAWGTETVEIATGGAIPLVKAMSDGVPDAAIFVFGATDSFANIHGPDERLLVDEWEKAVLAETLFFEEFANRAKGSR